jgi:adenosylhomocysteine nucleosidase
MDDVTIFAALGWERRVVTAALAEVNDVAGVGWRGRSGDGAQCLVMQTGVGPERAARAAADAPASRLFLAPGCAGALVPWLRAGDVVAAGAIGDAGGGPSRPLASGETLAAAAARHGLRVLVGCVVSSPSVLGTAADKAAAGAGGALVVDMESAALARGALARGIPFAAVRVVLDHADDALPALPGVLDEATGEVRTAAAWRALLRPRAWPVLARLARRQRLAARALGRVMAVLLADGVGALAAAVPARATAR